MDDGAPWRRVETGKGAGSRLLDIQLRVEARVKSVPCRRQERSLHFTARVGPPRSSSSRRVEMHRSRAMATRRMVRVPEADRTSAPAASSSAADIKLPEMTRSMMIACAGSRSGASAPLLAGAQGSSRLVSDAGAPSVACRCIAAIPIIPPSPISCTALLGTIISAPFCLIPSKRMFIARSCSAVGFF
jgi:hypothetical protein